MSERCTLSSGSNTHQIHFELKDRTCRVEEINTVYDTHITTAPPSHPHEFLTVKAIISSLPRLPHGLHFSNTMVRIM